MYLRFTTRFINPHGFEETGVFMALKYLRDDHGIVKDDDVKSLKEISTWFDKNLDRPTRFSNGTSKHNDKISLSWFKDSAKEHINKLQQFIDIAEKYDILIDRVATKTPGYVIFEDEYQISAIPFKTDKKKVI